MKHPDRYRRVRQAIREVRDVAGFDEFDTTYPLWRRPRPGWRGLAREAKGLNIPDYQQRAIVLQARREVR